MSGQTNVLTPTGTRVEFCQKSICAINKSSYIIQCLATLLNQGDKTEAHTDTEQNSMKTKSKPFFYPLLIPRSFLSKSTSQPRSVQYHLFRNQKKILSQPVIQDLRALLILNVSRKPRSTSQPRFARHIHFFSSKISRNFRSQPRFACHIHSFFPQKIQEIS